VSATSNAPRTVSVIVPFRDVERHFASMLESLTWQEPTSAMEVIAVDNGSTDRSRGIAESFADRLDLRILDALDRRNASYARNVGVRAASCDRLLFVDADDQLAPGYVDAMTTALEHHRFVTSRVDCMTLNEEWVQLAHGDPWQTDSVPVGFDFLPVTGPNVALRRDLYEAAGGYPEDFSGCQDIVFAWRVQLAGASIHFVPDAVYRYRHRDSIRGLYRQCVNWGYSDAQLYDRFRALGMPPRDLGTGLREWVEVAAGLLRVRRRSEAAAMVTRLGYCVGRLKGSIRFRVRYL
jgi:glycosyltransferase involved in cell wall biosynthesis